MGDWLVRTHWFVCPGEPIALRIYERLEGVADEVRRRGGCPSGTQLLRFGFGAPRLVIAATCQKWGEDQELAREVTAGLADVQTLIATGTGVLEGEVAALAPEFVFAWSARQDVAAALGARFGPVRVGAVEVARVRGAAGRAVVERGGAPPRVLRERLARFDDEVEVVFGVASEAHGLVPLGAWSRDAWSGSIDVDLGAERSPLFASRLEGVSNAELVRDGIIELPSPCPGDADAIRLGRHGPQFIWRTEDERRALARAAMASTSPVERQAGAMMARRWRSLGLDAELRRLAGDDDPHVRAAAARALDALREPAAAAADAAEAPPRRDDAGLRAELRELRDALAGPSQAARPGGDSLALERLAALDAHPEARALLRQLLRDGPPPVRALARFWLALRGDPRAAEDDASCVTSPYAHALVGDPGVALARLVAFADAAIGLARLRDDGEHLRRVRVRLVELAYAASRTSYWMVRDGAPGPDAPPAPPPVAPAAMRLWDGRAAGLAARVTFWSHAARRALLLADPWRGTIAALVALERIVEVGLESPVWRMPALEHLQTLVAAALDPGPPTPASAD